MTTNFTPDALGLTAIGAFEELMVLGEGGMGVVHLARATGPGGFERLVVIKRLASRLTGEAASMRRLLDEARVSAHVRHPNVVATHMVGSDALGHFLVLEYVDGGSLEDLIDRAQLRSLALPPPVVLRIALDALAGLHAAHEARDTSGRRLDLLHRDISIQNVLIGRDGQARVADFGIAKSVLGSVVTDNNYLVGKLMYVPPEHLRREPGGPEFDIYSLGLSLWIALAGNDPWPNDDEATLVTRILSEGVPLLGKHMQIAPEIEALLAKACHHDRTQRFQSAREMANAIEKLGRDTGWLASHGEVADLVQSLMGSDLAHRDECIAMLATSPNRRLQGATPNDESVPTLPRLAAPASDARKLPAKAETSSALSTQIEPLDLPLKPRAPRMVWLLAVLLVGGVAVTLSFIAIDWSSTTASAAAPPKPTPAPSASVRAPAPSAADHTPPKLPAQSAEVKSPPAAAPAPPRPTRTAPAAPTLKAPAVKPVQPPPSAGIKKQNPYR